MKYGHTKRARPELEILRGFELTEPAKQSDFLPVEDAVTVVSGQLIYQKWVSADQKFVWALGCVAGSTPFIAWRDSDSPNYLGSGLLHGLSLGDTYEFQSAYFKGADTFTVDALLTYDGVTGDIKVAADGDVIIGRVTRPRRGAATAIAGHQLGERNIVTEGLYNGHTAGDVVQWASAFNGAIFVD